MTVYRYTFEWPDSNASEVYVTGTFDNWAKTCLLEKGDTGFAKTVELPFEKVLYKFVVDGNWHTSGSSKKEFDGSGIENNVLYPDDLVRLDSEDGVSEFSAISYPNSELSELDGPLEEVEGNEEDLGSSIQVTLKDDQSVNNVTAPAGAAGNCYAPRPVFSAAGGGSSHGILSRLRSLFKS